ncbi:hypothetical protein CL635_01840 [bacterium]|jgi:hybrid cluster-associated redox disulfide protein|nr:hypothetical protein [bacterium]|tara:strand:+ start:7757 stop:8296 length:540 start_codon:yes stop_codon:yes gene_type:complete
METATINQNMTVREIITLVPAAADIMLEYGLHCFSCSVGGVETLAEGCQMHGFDTDTLEALVEDINDAIGKAPARPQEITVTVDAARGIRDIASAEDKLDQILIITLDEQGGFCLEFQEKPLKGDIEFTHPEVSDVRIFASVLTLSRIGGATIDVREGRFKLNLPEDEGCCSNGGCDCK